MRQKIMLQSCCSALAIICATVAARPASAQSVGATSQLIQAITDANTNNDVFPNINLSGNVTTPSGTVVPTGTATSSDPVNNPPGLDITTGGSTLTLSGAGTVWNAGAYAGAFNVDGSGGGGVTVSNGAQLVIPDTAAVGFLSFNSGVLTVTGSGSSVTTDYFAVGRGGDATIMLTNGGQLTTSFSSLGECCGFTSATNITVLVDGVGTVWNAGYFSAGGATNNVNVTVSNGATIQATDGSGIGINGAGSMLVTGAGSSFVIGDSGALIIGGYTYGGEGQGTLTISDGAVVSASAVLMGVNDPGATGALIVNTNGILETGSLSPDAGSATVEFDDGILRATADSTPGSALISGFTPGAFTLGAGGLFLDSNGFNVTASSVMSGVGGLTKMGLGTLMLTGANTYAGATQVQAGTLEIDGDQSGAMGLTTVNTGGTLSGVGIVGGNVAVVGGAIAPGTAAMPGTLTINGSLTLDANSSLNYRLGQAGTVGGTLNDLLVVHGDLTLAGVLNVTQSAGGTFGPGVYRLIDYSGALTDNGLTLGSLPAGGSNVIQTSVAGQVNLVDVPGTLNFWDGPQGSPNDGVITGGNGVWQVGAPNVWTVANGQTNGAYQNDVFAIFSGMPGTVTVNDSVGGPVSVTGMQFASSGYTITGDPITLDAGDAIVRVGDGTAQGAAFTATIASVLTGPGQLDKTDLGTLILTGANSYTGGTIVSSGTLQLGDGGTTGSIPGNVTVDGTLAFDRSDVSTFAGVISGAGVIQQIGSGTTILSANSSAFSGQTQVVGGALLVGDTGVAAAALGGNINVQAGATLGGTGAIGGNVTVAGGGILAPGGSAAPGTLTVNGDLSLSSRSVLNYRLGQAGTAGGTLNDLLMVNGDLTLAGVLNVTVPAGGVFGPGVYRLIDYSGALTDNGLTLGSLPAGGSNVIQTSVAGQVNLVDVPGTLNFWDGPQGSPNDGVITGGNGVWQVGGPNVWTLVNGQTNGAYQNDVFAIFSGMPGTVTVNDSVGGPVSVTGMQFASSGYTITGDPITLDAGDAIVRVGDGTAQGAAFTATIASVLTGPGQLDKTDLGTLILTGANSYTGGTIVSSGTLQLGDGETTGSIPGDVKVDGTLAFDRSDVSTFAGAISGGGLVQQVGSGTTVLSANNSAFSGQTQVMAGTLEVDGVLGGSMQVLQGGRLTGVGQVGSTINSGVIAPGSSGGGFRTLTIAGDYMGQGGGLLVQTKLGGDASPTSRLIVTGSTAGATAVDVTNVGGLGARTQQGILVVQVDGASTGQFTLANGNYVVAGQPALVAGAYGYVLQKDSTNGDWYLRSSLPASGPGGSNTPIYQPGVPIYEAYASMLLSLSSLPTLRQRVGDRQWDAGDTDKDGVWGRIEGTTSHLDPAASTSGAQENIDSWKAQFGIDRILSGSQGGAHLVGGLTSQFGTASTGVSSGYGGGDIDTKDFGVGATLTWYGQHGVYVDAQSQAIWFNSDLSSKTVGREAAGQDGYGYGVSLETGQAIPIEQNLALTPQAQLSYTSTGFSDFSDRFGAEVAADKGDSLQGRLGLALDHQHTWEDTAGQTHQLSLYGLVNVKYEFLDGTGVLVSNTPIDSRPGHAWGGLGIGGNYTWGNGRYSVYGETTGDTDLSRFGDSYSVTATAGVRMKF